ncbi:hypothetical protein COV19_01050 [Candidatus Woesearchaeota archaeon CG10_big_fil_rev_8_21_14_0_10_44_13]|nr:MAG: hypothetical protein COV19_01050 [Candidatus Woesearchaeota archaeon CG10_big_fil_rev_8_21_14_0_10_44_13]
MPHEENIEAVCQRLAKLINSVATGKEKRIYREKIGESISHVMGLLDSNSEQYKRKTYEFVNITLEHCFDADMSIEQRDMVSRTEFWHIGGNGNGFRFGLYRTKLLLHIMMQKLIGAYIADRNDLSDIARKKFPLGVKDAFGVREIADHPSTPYVDFIGIYDEGMIDEETGIARIINTIEDNLSQFSEIGFGPEEADALSKKGFAAMFRRFCEAYVENFEAMNENYLYDIAKKMQKNEMKRALSRAGFSIVNIADIPAYYRDDKGRKHEATIASQDFIVPGNPLCNIAQDFIVFNTLDSANQFSADLKSRAQHLKLGIGKKVNYETIGKAESPHIKRGILLKDYEEETQTVICQLEDSGRVFLGFRGILENENFLHGIFGSADEGKWKKNNGLVDATVSGRRLDVAAASALRLMVIEVPAPYGINHYTSESILPLYYLEKDPKETSYFKDYISNPRAMRGKDGSIAGFYKALHFVLALEGFPDDMEFQMRTSWQNFISSRGEISDEAYEEEKVRRSDIRMNKDALPETKGRERERVCVFLDNIETAVLEEYAMKIEKDMASIKELFLEKKSYHSKRRELIRLTGRLTNQHKMMEKKYIVSDDAKNIIAESEKNVNNLAYVLVDIAGSLGSEEESFIEGLCSGLKSFDENMFKRAIEYGLYKKTEPLMRFFAEYSAKKKESKGELIFFEAMALAIREYEGGFKGCGRDADSRISDFEALIDKYFVKPEVVMKSDKYPLPKKALPFVPKGIGKRVFKIRQIDEAYRLAGEMLEKRGISDNIMGKIRSNIDYFCYEIDPSRKRNYIYEKI